MSRDQLADGGNADVRGFEGDANVPILQIIYLWYSIYI